MTMYVRGVHIEVDLNQNYKQFQSNLKLHKNEDYWTSCKNYSDSIKFQFVFFSNWIEH